MTALLNLTYPIHVSSTKARVSKSLNFELKCVKKKVSLKTIYLSTGTSKYLENITNMFVFFHLTTFRCLRVKEKLKIVKHIGLNTK